MVGAAFADPITNTLAFPAWHTQAAFEPSTGKVVEVLGSWAGDFAALADETVQAFALPVGDTTATTTTGQIEDRRAGGWTSKVARNAASTDVAVALAIEAADSCVTAGVLGIVGAVEAGTEVVAVEAPVP